MAAHAAVTAEQPAPRRTFAYAKLALELALIAFFVLYAARHAGQGRGVLAHVSGIGLATCASVIRAMCRHTWMQALLFNPLCE